MKNKKYHTVGTIPISNRKLMERGKNDTTITQIHHHLLVWLDAGILIKVGVK